MPPPRLRFLVYVIESPLGDDAYENRSEGAALILAGQLDDIDVSLRCALDRPHLERALTEGFGDVWNAEEYDFVFLHLSAHGDSNGIQLSDLTSVSWAELQHLLAPLNRLTGSRLILSLSACEGMNAIITIT